MIPRNAITRFDPFASLDTMKFTLVYDGDLPASGNSSGKIAYVSKIRNVFHDQLADLWDSHVALREIETSAYVRNLGKFEAGGGMTETFGPVLPDYKEWIPQDFSGVGDKYVHLAAPIKVGDSSFKPLVRESLYLACSLDILFLRKEEPGALVLQGGDIDNRIKTLFDALRMPDSQEAAKGEMPTADPLYVLMQSDSLISGFSVKTGRLLGERAAKAHAVRLWIDVNIEVLRIRPENMCLASG